MRLPVLLSMILFTGLVWLSASSASSDISTPIALQSDEENVRYFEKHIRPLFAQQCHGCHGPQKQKGGLRLDSPDAIKKGGDSGSILTAGDPEKSLLYKAVSYQDDELRMPPRGKLAGEQIDHVKQWIEGGAGLPKENAPIATTAALVKFDLKERLQHWSHQPIKTVSVPTITDTHWPITSIDPFIQSKWKALDLHGAPDADKRTWLRRVTFDLIGLPPTPVEIVAFEKDHSPAAYERVVDQLLARPEYGERWARHWLDLMRYADTMGHEFDFDLSNAWRYRNYVIRAFNVDVPYHQFVLEHLAGDLLPKPRLNQEEHWNESIQATAFLWLGEAKQAPVDVRQEQADRIDNQIDVIGKAFLGQTIACARCHDHKFDAIATRDYYSLYGVLASSRYQQAIIDDPKAGDELIKGLIQVHQILEEVAQKQLKAEAHSQLLIDGRYLEHDLKTASSQGLAWQRSAKPSVAHYHDAKTKQSLIRYVPEHSWDSGLFSEVLEGTLRTQSFQIDQRYLHINAAGFGGRIRIIVDGFNVIRDPIYGSLRKVINSPHSTWYTFDLNMWKGRQAYVEFLDGGPSDPSLGQDYSPGKEAWLQIRRMVTSDENQPPRNAAGEKQEQNSFHQPIQENEEWKKAWEQQQAIEKQLPAPRYALATADGTGHDEPVFVRGNHHIAGEMVPRGSMPVYCGTEPLKIGAGSGRLEFAQRLIDPKQNPFIARVIVNRIWKHHFGQGLVRTVDDLGHMGEEPSHPELLDYLANWFVTNGWSLKKLHRQLVLSRTYRQSSTNPDSAVMKLDPQNRWVTRMPLRRLEAEAIRDAMLSVSGQLMKGPIEVGVMPYLTSYMQGRGRPSSSGPLDGEGRRSIYLSVRRNFLPPLFASFDFPTPFTAIGKRSVSNIPAQSLALMNDPLVKDQAQHWANSMIKQHPKAETRIEVMYFSAFGRKPTVKEQQISHRFIDEQKGVEEKKAWTEFAHALFCSKEFIFIP
ncbi:MAG TPA: PSD1 and planctomycete cytochrome C domain-containing protein [Gemmatales bacterium]|nr:PSD1 and planctomycete cytochrome C domain-containing protein [Gemmatales bacterium]